MSFTESGRWIVPGPTLTLGGLGQHIEIKNKIILKGDFDVQNTNSGKQEIACNISILAIVMGLSQLGSTVPRSLQGREMPFRLLLPINLETRSSRRGRRLPEVLPWRKFRRPVGLISAIHYKDNYKDISKAWKDIDLSFNEHNIITKAPYERTVDTEKLWYHGER